MAQTLHVVGDQAVGDLDRRGCVMQPRAAAIHKDERVRVGAHRELRKWAGARGVSVGTGAA